MTPGVAVHKHRSSCETRRRHVTYLSRSLRGALRSVLHARAMLMPEQLRLSSPLPRLHGPAKQASSGVEQARACLDRPSESTNSDKSNSTVKNLQLNPELISSCILMLFHISGSHVTASEACVSQFRFSSTAAAAAALLLCRGSVTATRARCQP